MLQIKDLHVSYGGIKALRGVNIDVPDGKIVTLIGANGAGKSTLLRCLNILEQPDFGEIIFNGENILKKGTDDGLYIGSFKYKVVES